MTDFEGERVPRILVVNAHSIANAGDHVLLSVTIEELQRVFPDSPIVVAMNDPAVIPGHPEVVTLPSLTACFKHGSEQEGAWRVEVLRDIPRFVMTLLGSVLGSKEDRRNEARTSRERVSDSGLMRLLAAYREADLVVSSAGNFLFASGKIGVPLMLAFGALLLATVLGKPVYAMPQTLGPLATGGVGKWWQEAVMRRLATSARLLQVRDEASRELLKRLRAPLDRTIVAPDVALLFGVDRQDNRKIIATRRARLGITVINWQAQSATFSGQSAYEDAVARAARWFVDETNGEVYFFAQVTGPLGADDDRVPARRVAALLGDKATSVHLFDLTLPAETLQLCYGTMDIFLGTRLHSTLFAMVSGTPCAAIAYQPKTRGVFAMLDLADLTLPIEQARDDALVALTQKLWHERAIIAEQLATRLPVLQSAASQSAARIASDYAAFGAGNRASQ